MEPTDRYDYTMIRIQTKLSIALVAIMTISACSISRYQEEGEVLYTGIDRIEVVDPTPESTAAQTLATAQLEYAPSGSLMGSSTTRSPLPMYRQWLYMKYRGTDSGLGKWLHRLGKRPVWIRDVAPSIRAKVTERVLAEQGYLSARVESSVAPHAGDSTKASVSYYITLGELYRLDSVGYMPPLYINAEHSLEHERYSILQTGAPFKVSTLADDRGRVSRYLREQGYLYFTPEYIRYEADTLARPHAVQLRTRMVDNYPIEALHQWRIGKIRVRILDTDERTQRLSTDTLELSPGVIAYYRGALPIRPRVLDERIRLRPDSLYRSSLEELTHRSLTNIGTFSGIEMHYTSMTPRDSLASGTPGTVDMTILMRRDKPWSATLGANYLIKSNDLMGPGVSVSLSRGNLFGGGETLSISALGSYEWQTGTNPFRATNQAINSYNLSLEASLSVPTLLIPGRLGAYYPYPTTTTFRVSAQHMNRARYYELNALTLSASYDLTPVEGTTHSIVPLSLGYNVLSNTTTTFRDLLAENPSLGLSFMDQFIPQMSYTFTRDLRIGRGTEHRMWLRVGASQAGNLTKLLSLVGGGRYGETQSILGVPFAQFVKAHGELRYTHVLNRDQSLVLRAATGLIYSYGSLERSPYVEQYYVGGASSIRAFTVRSIGPGAYAPHRESAYSFMERVGEFKVELNAEWRARLVGNLEGALFVDTGNVWLLRQDASRPRAALGEVTSIGDFMNQIAVGTGLGVRYDIGYIVLRFDVGVPLHLPYQTEYAGWYNVPRFPRSLGYHLAIGYPF